jgi:thioredoxin reductase (NADPH)
VDQDTFQIVVVGGGIGGSAAALRAAQHTLRTAWICGDRTTAKASRVKYVYNVDNMIGVHSGIVRRKVIELLDGNAHAAARELLERTHFHISTEDIVENVLERLRGELAGSVTEMDEKAVSAHREGDQFVLETDRGRTVRGQAVVLSTGVMDRQPSIKMTTRTGKVVDDIRWIYPYANNESLLYCILCEGHLTRDTSTVVFGSSEAAAQVALMLHERYGIRVTLLTNGEPLAASEETRLLLSEYDIAVLSPRVVEILDPEGVSKGKMLRGFRLEDGTVVEARFGMVAMGLHRVYNDLARQLGAEVDARDGATEVAHVLVDDATSETSVRGLFAIGDMSRRRGAGPSLKQIYTAQEYAVRAVNAIDGRLRRPRREAILRRRRG